MKLLVNQFARMSTMTAKAPAGQTNILHHHCEADAKSAPSHKVSMHSTTYTAITRVDHKPLPLIDHKSLRLFHDLSQDVAPFLWKSNTEVIPLSWCDDVDLNVYSSPSIDYVSHWATQELNLNVERMLCNELPEIFGDPANISEK